MGVNKDSANLAAWYKKSYLVPADGQQEADNEDACGAYSDSPARSTIRRERCMNFYTAG